MRSPVLNTHITCFSAIARAFASFSATTIGRLTVSWYGLAVYPWRSHASRYSP